MRGKENLNGSAIAFLFAAKHLEQLDHAAAIPPGLRQDLQANPVRVPFVITAELEEHAVGEQRAGNLRGAGAAGVTQHRAQHPEAPVRDDRLGELVGGMATGNVRDLVGHHPSHLRFVGRRTQHAAIDPDRPSRQRERIDLPVVRHGKRVGILRARCCRREPLANPPDVGGDLRIAQLRRRLADLRVRLAAYLDLLRNGNERDAGECQRERVSRATRQSCAAADRFGRLTRDLTPAVWGRQPFRPGDAGGAGRRQQ